MGRDMVTKSRILDKRTNTAASIREAAQWLQIALMSNDKEEVKKNVTLALWHLYTTGVTELLPPSSEDHRFNK